MKIGKRPWLKKFYALVSLVNIASWTYFCIKVIVESFEHRKEFMDGSSDLEVILSLAGVSIFFALLIQLLLHLSVQIYLHLKDRK